MNMCMYVVQFHVSLGQISTCVAPDEELSVWQLLWGQTFAAQSIVLLAVL